MFRPRIIPVLLLQNNVLVKSIAFKNHRYIGDPINAVRLFNDLKADELVFLDILATKKKSSISVELVKKIGEESNMPFAVGGGITTLQQIRELINAGAEKVIIGTEAVNNPKFIQEASAEFGSSTIVVCIDVKKKLFAKQQVWSINGTRPSGIEPEKFAQLMQENGAGEIIIQSIEKDGQMTGYDIDLIKRISKAVTIPVIALGGAGSIMDFRKAYIEGYANGLAAGSMFVYQGTNKGVLINYPDNDDIRNINKV